MSKLEDILVLAIQRQKNQPRLNKLPELTLPQAIEAIKSLFEAVVGADDTDGNFGNTEFWHGRNSLRRELRERIKEV